MLSDYFILTKPRVSAMVVLTAAGGYVLGCLRSGISPFSFSLVQALFGITLVTAGSSALNQAFERVTDHRIGLVNGLVTGFLLTFLGSLYLVWTTNLLTGTLTLLTAVSYVGIYTPLKRITRLNTFIGAFPGAAPPLIGWTAARGIIEWPAIALFAILFVWQFPHFMAIGWMYRKDYDKAGIRVTATLQPVGRAARSSVIQALLYAVLMIPISIWPTYLHVTGIPYAIAAFALGAWYLYATVRFASIVRNPEDPANRSVARNLLKVSVMYLPLLLLAMALNAQGQLFF